MQSGLILLVDTDRRVQKAFTRAAAEQGLEVVACDSARAGVNAACALEPTAIVTELELPDFDGHWLLAQIRDQPTEVSVTPIVVVTHEIDSSSRVRTLEAGADVFLQKPIAAIDLLAQVRALVEMTRRILDRRRNSILGMPPRTPAPPSAREATAEVPVVVSIPGLGPVPVARPAEPPRSIRIPPDVAAALDPAAALAALEGPTPAAAPDEAPDSAWDLEPSTPRRPGTAQAVDSSERPTQRPPPRTTNRPPRATNRPPPRTSQRPPPAKAGQTRPPGRPSKPPKPNDGAPAPNAKPSVPKAPPVRIPPARLPAVTPSVARPPPTKPAATAFVPRAPNTLGIQPVVPPAPAARPAPAQAASPPKPAAAATATTDPRRKGAPRTPPPTSDDEDIIEAENEG